VTFAPDGEPLVYDSIHPCGCYHLFFPTRSRNAFVPASLTRHEFQSYDELRSLPRERRFELDLAGRP